MVTDAPATTTPTYRTLVRGPVTPGLGTTVMHERVEPFPPDPRAADYEPRYFYGCRNRPPGYAAVPKGMIGTLPALFLPSCLAFFPHGYAVYARPLTPTECRSYELNPVLPWPDVDDVRRWSLLLDALIRVWATSRAMVMTDGTLVDEYAVELGHVAWIAADPPALIDVLRQFGLVVAY